MPPQDKLEMLANVTLQRMFNLVSSAAMDIGPLVARGFIGREVIDPLAALSEQIVAEAHRRGLSLEGELHGQN
jgi:hypothetical protein